MRGTLRFQNRGLSQERMALEAEIDRSHVGRIERSMKNVIVATLQALAKALFVNVSALFAEIDPNDTRPMSLRSGWKQKTS